MIYSVEDKYRLIKGELLQYKGKNPFEILTTLMQKDYILIHGPEHHFLDGACFLTAVHNYLADFDLNVSLDKLGERTIKMPGAMCGNWGVCGSVASLGAALSVLHDVGPLTDNEYYADNMKFTSSVINRMSEIGGPRCCKRNAFLSIGYAIEFVKENYGIELEGREIICEFSELNKQCLGNKCPFNKYYENGKR